MISTPFSKYIVLLDQKIDISTCLHFPLVLTMTALSLTVPNVIHLIRIQNINYFYSFRLSSIRLIDSYYLINIKNISSREERKFYFQMNPFSFYFETRVASIGTIVLPSSSSISTNSPSRHFLLPKFPPTNHTTEPNLLLTNVPGKKLFRSSQYDCLFVCLFFCILLLTTSRKTFESKTIYYSLPICIPTTYINTSQE